MTLKSLVTGVAAAAVMGGAAVGVTSIASPAIAGADDCVDAGTLQGVLNKPYSIRDLETLLARVEMAAADAGLQPVK